jgi:preprotein translocase subunit SecY
VSTLVTGTMFLMWLGEQITERGLGNGISIIIFAGIAAGLPGSLGGLFELVRTGAAMHPFTALVICVLVVAVTAVVVFVERGQRKILVNYAKRQVGNKIYGGQSSHLPLKLNMSGVIPPIFASSIILFPATLAQWFGSSESIELAEGSGLHACSRAADLRDSCTQQRSSSSASSIPRSSSTRRRRPIT